MRILKRIKGKWYVYEVVTRYLGPVEKVGTEEEKKRVRFNPVFFKQGEFRYVKELSSIVGSLLKNEEVELQRVYIYGSQIKGGYGRKSDLDVWVKVKPRRAVDEGLYSGPTLLTATERMDKPPKSLPRVKLEGTEVEICRSTLDPMPPYFDVYKQRLVG